MQPFKSTANLTGIEYFQIKYAHEAEELKSVKAPRTIDDLIVKEPRLS